MNWAHDINQGLHSLLFRGQTCFHLSLAAAWLKGSDCDRLLLFLPLTFSQIPKLLFFYSTRTDKGIEKLWLSMVTYVLCLEGNQAHSFSWILQTHSSLESLMFALQWCPPFPRQDASQKAQAQGGPPRGVLEWPYTAAWKLIIHLHSRLYIQGLQIGSWKLAMVGGFTFRTLRKKVKRNQGLPCPAHQTLPPPPSPRELDLKHQHTAGSM